MGMEGDLASAPIGGLPTEDQDENEIGMSHSCTAVASLQVGGGSELLPSGFSSQS